MISYSKLLVPMLKEFDYIESIIADKWISEYEVTNGGIIKWTKTLNHIYFLRCGNTFTREKVNYQFRVYVSMGYFKKMKRRKHAKNILKEQILKGQIIGTYDSLNFIKISKYFCMT